ncbi:dephospho-CoA kinase [Oceanospirillum beijerinckii]|uniref:dephospho-CoA kinase n=1 Tax=Oceanospirillum beijerinckii TaxID=64976 RepID=UPI00316AE735
MVVDRLIFDYDSNKKKASLIIGLTGGIGSGKTAASDYFTSLGVLIVDADVVAREIVEPHKPVWQQIVNHFGSEAINEDQSLNRPWLRQTVFQQPEERQWLESVTHPAIREEIIQQLQQPTEHYAMLVSPLLFESGQSDMTQRNLLIDVPVELQLSRTCARDNNNEDQVKAIIAAQMSREERRARADDIIVNDQDLSALQHACDDLHKTYLTLVS